ncbi:TPA: DUF1642 domain-containing protein [Enterococcus faecalis]|nr:DUF1642 domain-containing protein [Enterococcus faecalis]
MNKQEKEDLIQALYDIGGCEAEDEWARGYDDGVNAAIDVIKELKVQEKAIVPKFVAYWFEDNFEELDWELGGVLINAFNTNRNERSHFQDWLVDTTNYPIETLIRMKLFGYEVEKEQLYYVDFINDGDVHKRLILDHENGKHNIVDWSDNLIGLVQEIFTEQEIKAIDERYWPFAVKVEEE